MVKLGNIEPITNQHCSSTHPYIRLCKWLKQLDSKLSPVKGFMGSNPLSMKFQVIYDRICFLSEGNTDITTRVRIGTVHFLIN